MFNHQRFQNEIKQVFTILSGVPGPEFSSIEAVYESLEKRGALSLRSWTVIRTVA